MWKSVVISGVILVFCVVSGYGNLVRNSEGGKRLDEDSGTSQDGSSSELQDSSNRSLSVERNMMLYKTVFALSLKLLTVFLIVKLFGSVLSSTGVIRPGWSPQPLYYTAGVDPNQAVGWAQQPLTLVATGGTGNGFAVTGDAAGVGGTGTILTSTTTGAAAGSSTGNGGTFIAAASSNSRPSFLVPTGPRLRFGPISGRHPPLHMMSPMAYMGQPDTRLVETHSHVYVLPDGTQARIPVVGQARPAAVAATINTNTSSSESSTSERPSADSIRITSDSASSTAQRRSSSVFREKLYDDWILHSNPGTRSL